MPYGATHCLGASVGLPERKARLWELRALPRQCWCRSTRASLWSPWVRQEEALPVGAAKVTDNIRAHSPFWLVFVSV